MSVFGIITDDSRVVTDSMQEIAVKLSGINPVKNPFKASLQTYPKGYIMSIIPLYPNYTLFGWVVALGSYWVWRFNWLTIAGILIGCLGIFWTKYFYMFMLRLALRKKGYTGKISFINSDQIIQEWVL